jgi:hypothetical protein
MADRETDDLAGDLLKKAAETLVSETVKVLIGPAAGPAAIVLSRTGKKIFSIWLEKNSPSAANTDNQFKLPSGQFPPFAIVGLGRCGTHITAHVARMVIDSLNRNPNTERERARFLFRLFGRAQVDPKFTIEPLMMVGDLDPTTLEEIRGLIAISKDGQIDEDRDGFFRRILKIGYDPLSVSGAGHLPIVGQFITRCLLALPSKVNGGDLEGWAKARSYLLDYSTQESSATRMVFYVFSAGGGSGSGSAPELMRAQRLALIAPDNPDPEMYFCGISVLPYDQKRNKTHRVNTGRFFIQYLADLAIRLPDKSYYYRALEYEYGLTLRTGDAIKPIEPWDGLAVVSNDTLRASEKGVSKEEVDQHVNQYVAQQIFNLASGQISVLQYERTDDIAPSQLNFQSVRMDPADLKNGLIGPFAVGFAIAQSSPADENSWIDSLVLKALMPPQLNEQREPSRQTGFIQGLSISPEAIGSKEQIEYDTAISRLFEGVSDKASTGLTQSAVQFFTQVPLYKRCPNVIFVFTAPQTGLIPANVDRRISEVLSWLMPNLNQARYAVVRGTTQVYTLSVFMQSSVVLCPEVLDAIRDYLYLCWKTRSLGENDFDKLWDNLMYEGDTINENELLEFVGESEELAPEFARFEQTTRDYGQKWQNVLNDYASVVGDELSHLRNYRLKDCRVTYGEVVAALKYLRYVHNVEARHGTSSRRPR